MKLLNEILGTKYPIIQGGMANIATGEFAAACSNAGALGIIGAGGMNADTLRENIRRCKQLTDKPFGVNIMLMHPQADEFAQIVVEEGVQVVTTGAGNPGKYIPAWKEAGIRWEGSSGIFLCTTILPRLTERESGYCFCRFLMWVWMVRSVTLKCAATPLTVSVPFRDARFRYAITSPITSMFKTPFRCPVRRQSAAVSLLCSVANYSNGFRQKIVRVFRFL